MAYQVLARKWRPKNFQTMVGQEHTVRALANALDQNRLHHAYLFTGTRGIGKTTLARILAKCFNCETGITSKPCGTCSPCQEIDAGRYIDLIEVDAASRTKVEDTRELLENVQYTPTKGRYKVYLIDEVHMLSGHSFNALLKTLEEPPPHVKFLLATTDSQKLPITVLSRCLQFHLKNLSPEQIAKHLQHILQEEKITADNEAIKLLAKSADGSLRDALSLLDQAIAYSNGKITNTDIRNMLGAVESSQLLDMISALTANNGEELFTLIKNLADHGVDFSQVLEEMLSCLHQLAICQTIPNLSNGDWDYGEQARNLAKQLSPEEVQLFYQIGLIGRRDLPLAPTAKSGFEMIMLRMLAFRPTDTTVSIKNTATKLSQPEKPKPPLTRPEDWPTLLTQLNLSGASRALAAHCSLTKLAEDHATLLLDPNHSLLLHEQHKQRIAAAFSEYFQRPIKINIEVGKLTSETPAAQAERQQTEKQQAAAQSINDDKQVQAIIKTFNATIVSESIKAIEK
jgi:DNA polymerase-3 subunit gamma/tau